MKQCERDAAMLAQYLDGELPPDQATRVQQHVSECPHCAAEVSVLVSMKRNLRAANRQFTPSTEFRRKIQQQISKPSAQWRMRFVWAFAMLAAVLLVAVAWLEHPRSTDSFSEVADLHVSALASANPVDVVSTDRHTVKPWFQGRIPFSFNIPELAGTEFALLGGRMVYLNQQAGAQLIFTVRQHKVSVLIFQESSGLAGALTDGGDVERRNAFNVAAWKAQGLRFIVIGDADANEIRKLVQMIKVANT
jgi:anti-sigma factor RsiW